MHAIKRISVVLSLLLELFFGLIVKAQDLHCSQFWMNTMSINPATTGLIEDDLRAGLYTRTQWLSVTKPYQTNGIWADAPVWKRKVQQDIFGAGLGVDMDQAGDSKYRTLQLNGYVSYSKSLNYKNNHFLSGGLMLGVVQKQLDERKLTTDEQFQGGIYDPVIPIKDVFPSSSFIYPDVGVGMRWFYKPSSAYAFDAGFSVMHLNSPRYSLMKDEQIRLPMKYTAMLQVNFPVNLGWALRPAIYLSRQGVYQEVMCGVLGAYSFHFDQKGYVNKWIFGLDYRVGDAIYLVTGMLWRRIQVQMSYDFNISRLSEASHGRGGFELSAIYMYKRSRVMRPYKMPCPIFN